MTYIEEQRIARDEEGTLREEEIALKKEERLKKRLELVKKKSIEKIEMKLYEKRGNPVTPVSLQILCLVKLQIISQRL
ncbi:hypothetical protein PR048_011202 [Dryococelus australis]|uniref:Uncharacterized protein n=1 Tax=Dryococelus australis TaxID=614101 RepID=A0ABQ9HLP2_9NEOP|nr:hypothetical protein PR048_011202 [Dryococelus australis]